MGALSVKWPKYIFSSVLLSGLLVSSATPSLAGQATSQNGRQPAAVAQGTGSAVLKKASFFSDMPDSKKISIDIVLKTRNQTLLQRFIQDSVNPASSAYHHYISVKTFKDTFGAAAGTVNEATSYLKKYGIHTSVYPDNLIITATGTVGQFNKAFSVDIQKAKLSGKTFQATKQDPTVPQYISKNVLAVLGLSDYSMFSSQSVKPPVRMHSQQSSGPLQQNPSDLVHRYHASSLYNNGNRGKGQTIGIVTLATFNTSDAYHFWEKEKIKTKANRIHVKTIDGSPSWDGYDETTLNVEQSGALAPDADINVYVGSDTDSGFIDAFASAINENKAQQISDSWGNSETVLIKATKEKVQSPEYAQVFDELLSEACAQGISSFAASGDTGAYDDQQALGTYQLDVDNPADSPYITAAGGTTLPWRATTANGTHISVSSERAWGWDYLYHFFDTIGLNTAKGRAQNYFSGGGGGFSVLFPTPDYQKAVSGVNTYTAAQEWQPNKTYTSVQRMKKAKIATGKGAGRNVPDIAMDADPYTGYKVYYSSPGKPGNQGKWDTYGGTSLVAPQLAGLNALMNNAEHSRIGFWNPQIYRFAKLKSSPFHPLNTKGTANDNLYYTGTAGKLYNQATGLGTPDFSSLAGLFKSQAKPSGGSGFSWTAYEKKYQ